MTKAQLERENRLLKKADKRIETIIAVGHGMSNHLYNWAQDKRVPDGLRKQMKLVYGRWDKAVRNG